MQRQHTAASSSTSSEKEMLHFDADGALKLPLSFRQTAHSLDPQQAPKPQAVYIKAFDEIFSEIGDFDERKQLLSQIDDFLAKHKDFEIFIDVPELNEADRKTESMIQSCFRKTVKHLGRENHICPLLMKKEKDKVDIYAFKEKCRQRGIETVYLGGVFGRACVWSAARKMAKNIYSKQLGDFHPNIRFVDSKEPFSFTNAIIWPELTEGYFYDPTTFDRFVLFPAVGEPITINALEAPAQLEKAEEQLRKFFPGRLGESYEDLRSKAEDTAELESFFFENMQKLLNQASNKLGLRSSQSGLFSHSDFKTEDVKKPERETQAGKENKATSNTP